MNENQELPPLPEPDYEHPCGATYFTPDRMHAYEAEAKPAPAPLTNADVVEAWRTTEARRDDYGWTSCEWFQEGVRFAQRHYRVGAAAPAAPAPLTDEQISELAHEMVKGGKSINWLLRAIERAHGIGKGGAA